MGYSPWGHKELDTTERLHPLTLLSNKTKVMIMLLPRLHASKGKGDEMLLPRLHYVIKG